MEDQVAEAVSPLPESARASAATIDYNAKGDPIVLRQGTNGIIRTPNHPFPGIESFLVLCDGKGFAPLSGNTRGVRPLRFLPATYRDSLGHSAQRYTFCSDACLSQTVINNQENSMRLTLACLLLPALAFAQDNVDLKAEEAAIRAAIAKGTGSRDRWTSDAIRWSGAEPRPSILPERVKPFPEAQVEKRTNQTDHFDIQRIDVASSGDMAYEFSYGKLEFDIGSQHRVINQGMLRVWKKVNGQWKVAAMFVRPLDERFVTSEPGK
jgi:hypothetical protein